MLNNRFSMQEEKTGPYIAPVFSENKAPVQGALEALTLLEQQIDNFDSLQAFITTYNITPGMIFLPQTLQIIDKEIASDSSFIVEALSFLDVVNTYSFFIFGDSQRIVSTLGSSAVTNRSASGLEGVLSGESLDDFIFSSLNDGVKFLENNKVLISIYIFSLVSLIFYRKAGR